MIVIHSGIVSMNAMSPWICGTNLYRIIFKLIIQNSKLDNCCKIVSRWMNAHTQSLPHSLPHSFPHSFPHSLPHSLAPSLPPSLIHSLYIVSEYIYIQYIRIYISVLLYKFTIVILYHHHHQHDIIVISIIYIEQNNFHVTATVTQLIVNSYICRT